MQAVVSPLESESLIGLDLAAVLQRRIKQGHALVGIAVGRPALYTQQFAHLVISDGVCRGSRSHTRQTSSCKTK